MHQPALRLLLAAACWLALALTPAAAQHLADFLPDATPAELVPGATRFGPPECTPAIAPAYAGDKLLGWAYLNTDLTTATGYSGWPIRILIGLTTEWHIAGAKLVEHHEPLLISGVDPARVDAVLKSYAGLDVTGITTIAGHRPTALISGASVSMTVMGDSILRSAVLLLRQHHPEAAPPPAEAAPVRDDAPLRDWPALIADGTLRHLHLRVGEVSDAFAGAGFAATTPEREDPAADFIDLYAAVIASAATGRSLLGEAGWQQLQPDLKAGAALALFANGAYAYKGAGPPRVGPFNRFALLQGERTIRFTDRDQRRLEGASAAGAPGFSQADLFIMPADAAFDPARPWRVQLLAERGQAFLTFDLASGGGTVPPAAETGWQAEWHAQSGRIAVVGVALALLTGVFFFQEQLARRPKLQDRLRIGFLLFTLLWIGGYAGAQLSVVNVLDFLSALRGDFHWDAFLMAPVVFILWAATAVAMLFWNRGAFCGWLCPYGAAQELLNRAARRLGIRQLAVPFGLHQRLTALKYIVFLVLFGISLDALATAEWAAEVEPFRTVFVLRFARTWPFVLYALLPLAAGLVVERAFCRYLCPLGAALAIPARLRLFDWLRRWRDCGNPCQRCAHECPVEAIHPEGHINPAECIQCLHCQVLYHHEQHCPVMVKRRQRREKFAALKTAGE